MEYLPWTAVHVKDPCSVEGKVCHGSGKMIADTGDLTALLTVALSRCSNARLLSAIIS